MFDDPVDFSASSGVRRTQNLSSSDDNDDGDDLPFVWGDGGPTPPREQTCTMDFAASIVSPTCVASLL